MRWLDLTPHGCRLSLVEREGGAAVVRLTGHVASEVAQQLGFEPEPGAGFVRTDPVLDAPFWRGLKAAYPAATVVDLALEDVFEREADNEPSLGRGEPRQISYRKVGRHRGRARLWLEGLRLSDCGFGPGARYSVTFDVDARVIRLSLDPEGDRAVSRRRRPGGDEMPILDLCAPDIDQVVGQAARVRAVLDDGCIEFSLHPVDIAIAGREARLRANLEEGRLTEGVLCAGGGVSALAVKDGFDRAGLATEVEWLIDREQRYLDAARQNNPAVHPDVCLVEASLEEVEPGLLAPVDVVTVSLPCTGHSVAGKAKRGLALAEEHPTDALAVFGMLKILEAVQPSVVISENVTQAATSATYALVRAYLQEQGYVMAECTLDGGDAGSLENRTRWWFVAISRGFAETLSLDSLPPRPREYARLGDALEALPDTSPEWRHHDFLDRKQERDAARGAGFARQLVTEDSEQVGTIGRGYHKRRSTEPFLVRGDGKERLLTPVEHCRVKGAPEVLVRGLSAQLAHEIMGQSILYHHATAIAERVGQILLRNLQAGGAVPEPDDAADAVVDTQPSLFARGPGL